MAVAQETPESDRLARLEATVDYLVREVGDIKAMMGSEMRGIRTELHEAIDGVRNEVGSVRSEVGSVRSEMGSVRSEMSGVRTELHETIDGVRNEVGSVRGEMSDIRVALREEMHIMQGGHGQASPRIASRSSRDCRDLHRCHGSHVGVYRDSLDCGTFLKGVDQGEVSADAYWRCRAGS